MLKPFCGSGTTWIPITMATLDPYLDSFEIRIPDTAVRKIKKKREIINLSYWFLNFYTFSIKVS